MLIASTIKNFLSFTTPQKDSVSQATPAEKVHVNKIKGVVVDAFLASLPGGDVEHSPLCKTKIADRLTSKILKKTYYSIPCEKQPLGSGEILDWFVKGELGQQLHRRAIVNQDKEVESFLRKAHVDVNQPDEETGDTPLILAARIHDAVTVKVLLEADATISTRNHGNKDAIYEALEKLNHFTYRDDNQFKTIECLLEHGADVNQRLLHKPAIRLSEYAIPKAELRLAKLLASHSESINACAVRKLISERYTDRLDIINHLLSHPKFDPEGSTSCDDIALIERTTDGIYKSKKVLSMKAINATDATTIRPLTGFEKYWVLSWLMKQRDPEACSETSEDFGVLKIIPKYTTNETLSDKNHADLADKVKSKPASEAVLGFLFYPGFFLTIGAVSMTNKGMRIKKMLRIQQNQLLDLTILKAHAYKKDAPDTAKSITRPYNSQSTIVDLAMSE